MKSARRSESRRSDSRESGKRSTRGGAARAEPARAGQTGGSALPALVREARGLLGAVLEFAQPADAVVSRYFRAHPQLGQRDRHVLAETVYAVVRNLRLWRHLAQGHTAGISEAMRLLTLGWQGPPEMLGESLLPWREQTLALDVSGLDPALRYSLPEWLGEQLKAALGGEFEALAASLLQPAPLDLRVNVLKTTREAARQELTQLGIQAEPTALSPWGLRVQGKPALQRSALFEQGAIEVQDEGSQLLALLLAPRRGEMVADFCAGAGGKTLALGAMMRNTGRLYAFDVSERRLDKLRPRLARSGLSNVYPVVIRHERDERVQRLAGKLDRVLVDAPCSGVGTLRRNPDLKWRLKPEDLERLVEQQTSILSHAARLLKPQGRLVYATCSLLPAENRDVVQAFLGAHEHFEMVDAGAILAQQGVAHASDASGALQLFPHRDGTDGFYAAVLQRRA